MKPRRNKITRRRDLLFRAIKRWPQRAKKRPPSKGARSARAAPGAMPARGASAEDAPPVDPASAPAVKAALRAQLQALVGDDSSVTKRKGALRALAELVGAPGGCAPALLDEGGPSRIRWRHVLIRVVAFLAAEAERPKGGVKRAEAERLRALLTAAAERPGLQLRKVARELLAHVVGVLVGAVSRDGVVDEPHYECARDRDSAYLRARARARGRARAHARARMRGARGGPAPLSAVGAGPSRPPRGAVARACALGARRAHRCSRSCPAPTARRPPRPPPTPARPAPPPAPRG